MRHSLLPNDVRNRVIKDKTDIQKFFARAYVEDSGIKTFNNFASIMKRVDPQIKVHMDCDTQHKMKCHIDYDIICFYVECDKIKNMTKINHRVDVYFQTRDILAVKRYKNMIGKYSVQDIDGVTYWVTCKDYDWSKIKVS